ncbi:MAG: PP2C family protein-serine/threonine phosphatase [Mycobacteriales bacterium]
MRDAELALAVLQALDEARPDAMVAVVRSQLADYLQASDIRLLLADYQLTALRAIQDPDDRVPLRGTPAGEAFVTQHPVSRPADRAGTTVYLPVSVRGDRLGVLQLTLARRPAPARLRQLSQLAAVIGYALSGATRQSEIVHRAARSQRLTLAAELQWQLLPGRGCRAPEYVVAGHLEPAYQVHADNFDWSQDEDQLVVSITDAAPDSQGASLLTTLAVTAIRNARRAGLGIADQASMADQAVYAHHQGKKYISTLLLRIDLTTGAASVVRAGSPRLLVLRDGEIHLPELSDQLPLGMFEGTDYAEEEFGVATGDRLVLVSDGIHAVRSLTRQRFGDGRLPDLLKATAGMPAGGVVRAVIDGLFAHGDLAELDDDAAVICLDWNGPAGAPSARLTHGAASRGSSRSSEPTRGLSVVPSPSSPDRRGRRGTG